MDRSSKLLDVDDDEKRRRERRRERESRSKDGKSRSGRKDRRLDIIDKLDVTSIYGTGSKCLGFYFPFSHFRVYDSYANDYNSVPSRWSV